MMMQQKEKEDNPEMYRDLPKKKSVSSKKRQQKFSREELAEKKLFSKIEHELKEIEKKRESDELQNKASILTFNASGSKKHNSSFSPSKKKISPLVNQLNEKKVSYGKSPQSTRRSPGQSDPQRSGLKSRSMTPVHQAAFGAGVENSRYAKNKPLSPSHMFEDMAMKQSKSYRETKNHKNSSKSPRPAVNTESSSHTESPEGLLRSAEKKRPSKLITPINPELYQKLQKKDPLANSSYKPFESRQLDELKSKPTINQKSKHINEKLNRGYFDNVHERLFYKGIETLNKRKELDSIEFNRMHTFKPVTGKEGVKSSLKKEDLDKLVYSYRDKETMLDRMRHVTHTYDKNDGKQLFTPRINKKPPASHAYTLEEVENWKHQSREYLVKLRQIFDFLDRNHTGVIEGRRLDFENMHPTMHELLSKITQAVIDYDAPMTFSLFYDLIDRQRLTEHVIQIFNTINREPLINPKPLKTRNFKFT